MSVPQALQWATPILLILGGAFLPAWVKTVIRGELKDCSEKVDDHDGRLQAMEQWRLLVGADVKSIPATNAVLERLERTIDRTDTTLDNLNKTCERMIERVARLEGRNGV